VRSAIKVKTAKARAEIAVQCLHLGLAGDREFDNCFEMGDGDKVWPLFLASCRDNPALMGILVRYGGQLWVDEMLAKFLPPPDEAPEAPPEVEAPDELTATAERIADDERAAAETGMSKTLIAGAQAWIDKEEATAAGRLNNNGETLPAAYYQPPVATSAIPGQTYFDMGCRDTWTQPTMF
jgi:hypothetical protein